MRPVRVLFGGLSCHRRRARGDPFPECPCHPVRTERPPVLYEGSSVVRCWVWCVRACQSDSRARRVPWAAAGARRRRSLAATCPHGWPRTNVSAMRITSAAPSSTRYEPLLSVPLNPSIAYTGVRRRERACLFGGKRTTCHIPK